MLLAKIIEFNPDLILRKCFFALTSRGCSVVGVFLVIS